VKQRRPKKAFVGISRGFFGKGGQTQSRLTDARRRFGVVKK
jgi:hypothetical protein